MESAVFLLVVAVLGVSAWAVVTELADPVVAPSILSEAGSSYPIQIYVAHALAAAAALTGAVHGLAIRRRRAA
jgi:hypothetical protein